MEIIPSKNEKMFCIEGFISVTAWERPAIILIELQVTFVSLKLATTLSTHTFVSIDKEFEICSCTGIVASVSFAKLITVFTSCGKVR